MNDILKVKPRYDGAGDGWAKAHRYALGPTFNMNDLDAFMGITAFAQNTGDKLFLEYVPDHYENRYKSIRNFAVVAFFDRKKSLEYAVSQSNVVSLAFYLWLCRVVSTKQKKAVRFFFVVGGQNPPWSMQEIDIQTGRMRGNAILIKSTDKMEWQTIWEATGLKNLRDIFRREIANHA